MLLAVDTSTTQAGIALYDGQVQAEAAWRAGRDHGRQLLPVIRDTLARLGRTPADLTAVGAARGPGSFTGLRVGLSVGRGLTFALGIPLYGIGSLDVLAAGLAGYSGPIRAVLEAGRGRVASARYRPTDGGLVPLDEIRGLSADELLDLVRDETRDEPGAVVGDLTAEARERLAALGTRVFVAPPAACVRRPAVLAELAWARFTAGATPDPSEGEPIYLTRS